MLHRTWRFAAPLTFFAFLLFGKNGFANVSWKNNPTILKVPAGQTISINLAAANLVDNVDASKPLMFALSKNPMNPSEGAPSWLRIDTDQQTLLSESPHPTFPEAGIYKFGMAAGQGVDAGAIVEFHLVVVTVPDCGGLTQLNMTAPENTSFQSTDAMTVCKDPAGGTLGYKLNDPAGNKPSWVTLSGGQFRGMAPWTSGHFNVGTYTGFDLEISTSSGGSLRLPAVVQITRWFRPPMWTQDPILLSNAEEKILFREDLSVYVTNFENTPLQYSLVSGVPTSQWVSLDATSAILTGTPAHADVGQVNLGAELSTVDPESNTKITSKTQVQFRVTPAPQPPSCDMLSITLPDATVGVTYIQSLSAHCTDPLGGVLTYAKKDGPLWAKVSSGGSVFGTPATGDVGLGTYQVQVTNANSSVTLTVFITVNPVPPPYWSQDPINLGKQTVGKAFEFDLNPFVKNASGQLTFQKTASSPAWISVRSDGRVSGTPAMADLGAYTTAFAVSNGGPLIEVAAYGEVIQAPPPQFLVDPIEFTIPAGKVFTANLNDPKFVLSPDGSALDFTIVNPPDWVVLTSTGGLTAAPNVAQVGDHTFNLVLKNVAGSTANGRLILHVTNDEKPNEDVVAIDDTVPWATAQAENLWIIDSAGSCSSQNTLVKWFKNELSSYFDPLNAAAVHHTGVYVSSNPVRVGLFKKKLTGKPVKGNSGSILMTSNQGSGIVADFRERIDSMITCKSCNSPIWAQRLFYDLLPDYSEYKSTYFLPEVPSDTLIVTAHADSYKHYSSSGKSPTDYAKDFTALHAAERKLLRINAVVTQCIGSGGRAEDDDDDSLMYAADANPYREHVNATGGGYWVARNQAEMKSALQQYAAQVKFRALVISKREVPLSKKPTDPSKIEVYLGGQPLAASLWRYNSAKNVVEIFWNQIDLAVLQPGDKIQIKYTAQPAH